MISAKHLHSRQKPNSTMIRVHSFVAGRCQAREHVKVQIRDSISADNLRMNIFRSLLTVVLVVGSATVSAQDDVAEAVRTTVLSVIETLKDNSLSDAEKKTLVASLVTERFDFEAMTSRVLATNWKRANATQKRRVTVLFQAMLTETYWQKFSAFSNEEVEFLAMQNRSSEHASFHTVIKSKSASIPVDYKLYRVGDTWKAYDVVIEHVSLVRNYRGKFQSIVRKSGIAGLIKHLEDASS